MNRFSQGSKGSSGAHTCDGDNNLMGGSRAATTTTSSATRKNNNNNTRNVHDMFLSHYALLSDVIRIPASFVVLQGIRGDGIANTIDTSPELPWQQDEIDIAVGNVGGGGESGSIHPNSDQQQQHQQQPTLNDPQTQAREILSSARAAISSHETPSFLSASSSASLSYERNNNNNNDASYSSSNMAMAASLYQGATTTPQYQASWLRASLGPTGLYMGRTTSLSQASPSSQPPPAAAAVHPIPSALSPDRIDLSKRASDNNDDDFLVVSDEAAMAAEEAEWNESLQTFASSQHGTTVGGGTRVMTGAATATSATTSAAVEEDESRKMPRTYQEEASPRHSRQFLGATTTTDTAAPETSIPLPPLLSTSVIPVLPSVSTSTIPMSPLLSTSTTTQTEQQQQRNSTARNSPYNALTPAEQRAVEKWHSDCRKDEITHRTEWTESASLSHAAAIRGGSGGGGTGIATYHPISNSSSSSSNNTNIHFNHNHHQGSASQQQQQNDWYLQDGRLALLKSLPAKVKIGETTSLCYPTVQGTLSPGTTVIGSELITISSTTFEPIAVEPIIPDANTTNHNRSRSSSTTTTGSTTFTLYPRGRYGWIQVLKLESPFPGHFVVMSIDGFRFLGPGLPTAYAVDPEHDTWLWRVTCPQGAFVRQGLDLCTEHIATIPYGSFVYVKRKTINAMGLARLQVRASIDLLDNDQEGNGNGNSGGTEIIDGWCSEVLNPLSGQSGAVVQPVPFPVPILYRVILPEGAVIRSDIELSSPNIGHAPFNAVLSITGRAFSEHPVDRCIERLRLAGNGGWISLRLNRPPPADHPVVAMVGVDGRFDPNYPGLYHLEAQRLVRRQLDAQHDPRLLHHHHSNHHLVESATSEMDDHTPITPDISSIDEDEEQEGRSSSSSLSSFLANADAAAAATATSSATPAAAAAADAVGVSDSHIPSQQQQQQQQSSPPPPSCTYYATAFLRQGRFAGPQQQQQQQLLNPQCLICLSADRNATFVHGETGHIACCLTCARLVKARDDACPVCRLPIDVVIQQFWA